MSATPAPTASKVSNGRTSVSAGNTSILMRPPVAAPTVCAKRTALVCRPGVPSGQSVTIFNCRTPCAIAGAEKLGPAPAAIDAAPAKRSRRLMCSFPPIRSREFPAVHEGAFGEVAPIHGGCSELLVAAVDLPGKIVGGADLGDDLAAQLEKRLEQGIVEFEDLDRALFAQLAQRLRVVGVELRERAGVFAGGYGGDHPAVVGVEAFPHALVDSDREAGARLVKRRIVIVPHGPVQPQRHVQPRPGPFAGIP